MDRTLLKGKYKKVTGLMKDQLAGKTIADFVALRTKTYSYLIDDGDENKKSKRHKKSGVKWKLKFEDYKNCLEEIQLENKVNQLEKKNLM